MKSVVAGSMGLSLALVLSSTAHAQPRMKLGEVLVLDVIANSPGGSPGNGLHLFRADRGSRKGQHVLASASRTELKDVERSLPAERFEYHLLSPDKVGALPAVDVLGIHYVKVRPERRDAFERFVSERLHPVVGNLRPDLRVLYYKLARGTAASNYIALFALTKESRDKYWPKGADSDDLRAAFSPDVRALTKELSTYLVDGSYAADAKLAAAVYESREWTDYVLVAPPNR